MDTKVLIESMNQGLCVKYHTFKEQSLITDVF